MKTNYFTKVEDKYVFRVSTAFWHLLIGIITIAAIVGIVLLVWSIIPPGKVSFATPLMDGTYHFDSTKVNLVALNYIFLYNNSNNSAKILKAYFLNINSVFNAPGNQLPKPISANSSIPLNISFNPNKEGVFFDTLLIITECDTFRLPFSGIGYDVARLPYILNTESNCYSKNYYLEDEENLKT